MNEVEILRELLDIVEGYLMCGLNAGTIEISPSDKKRYKKLNKELAELTARR